MTYNNLEEMLIRNLPKKHKKENSAIFSMIHFDIDKETSVYINTPLREGYGVRHINIFRTNKESLSININNTSETISSIIDESMKEFMRNIKLNEFLNV